MTAPLHTGPATGNRKCGSGREALGRSKVLKDRHALLLVSVKSRLRLPWRLIEGRARGYRHSGHRAGSKPPSRHRPGAETVAMPRCYEIALPGLRMESELPVVRSRLIAEFPQILSVDAIPTSATVVILYVGAAEPDAWLDALSDAVLNLRRRLRPSQFARPSRRRGHPPSSCTRSGRTGGCPGPRVRGASWTRGASWRRPRRTHHPH